MPELRAVDSHIPAATLTSSAESGVRVPAPIVTVESDELSDEALDEVVGGLARVWSDHGLARLIHG